MNEIGLYLHFPFCVRKCGYCDFLSFPASDDIKKLYAAAMIREIRGCAASVSGRRVTSIFLGGGTPSVMPVQQMRRIFSVLYECFDIAQDAEISMEINPGTLDEKILSFVFDHITRVSLGVQSFRDGELSGLGRIHTADEAVRSFELLRECGVRNLNIDLMSAIPGQSPESWAETLKTAVSLGPEHISAYSLIVEEGTPFFRMRQAGKLALPDEETEREMYRKTGEILGEAGYSRYEISNYAKPGFSCRHNIRYWRREDCLGLGLGAASLVGSVRWKNTDRMEEYLKHSADPGLLVREMEDLTRTAEVEEFMFLGLRMTEGVHADAFRECFGLEMTDIYGDVLARLLDRGLIYMPEPGRYALTERGTDVSNMVLSEFLLS